MLGQICILLQGCLGIDDMVCDEVGELVDPVE